jgi:hypothetical protein
MIVQINDHNVFFKVISECFDSWFRLRRSNSTENHILADERDLHTSLHGELMSIAGENPSSQDSIDHRNLSMSRDDSLHVPKVIFVVDEEMRASVFVDLGETQGDQLLSKPFVMDAFHEDRKAPIDEVSNQLSEGSAPWLTSRHIGDLNDVVAISEAISQRDGDRPLADV